MIEWLTASFILGYACSGLINIILAKINHKTAILKTSDIKELN